MKHILHIDTYQHMNESITNPSWEREGTRVTLADIEPHLEEELLIQPDSIAHLLIPTERDPRRVAQANLDHPIILTRDKGQLTSILDGQHRVTKAIEQGKWVKARQLDLDTVPEHIAKVLR